MSAQQPTAEPSVDVTAISIAVGMGSIAVLCAIAAVACARAYGVL